MSDGEGIRLQVYMARCGVGSRRSNETLITSGQVTVNGEVVTELGTKVSRGDIVRFQGKQLHLEQAKVYLALHKPRNYICTASDPQGRPTALSLVQDDFDERLFSVGRLDFLSSGLILFTNDGHFAKTVTHPRNQIEREYRVETQQPVPEELLDAYKNGIQIDGELLKLTSYRYKSSRSVVLVLAEGKNREIRRVFSSWKVTIKRLHRTRIGSVTIGSLPPAQYRPLSQKEIAAFFSWAGATARRQ